jgi:hypothetical protein
VTNTLSSWTAFLDIWTSWFLLKQRLVGGSCVTYMLTRSQHGFPTLVLFFDCPETTAEERVLTRRVGREGDNRETFNRRYREFKELNPRILEYYDNKGILVTVKTPDRPFSNDLMLEQVDTSGEKNGSYANLLDSLKKRQEWMLFVASMRNPRDSKIH